MDVRQVYLSGSNHPEVVANYVVSVHDESRMYTADSGIVIMQYNESKGNWEKIHHEVYYHYESGQIDQVGKIFGGNSEEVLLAYRDNSGYRLIYWVLGYIDGNPQLIQLAEGLFNEAKIENEKIYIYDDTYEHQFIWNERTFEKVQ